MALPRKNVPLFQVSLMDTLTNVLGILFLIGALTQSNVRETITRISTDSLGRDPVVQERLLSQTKDLEQREKELIDLQRELERLPAKVNKRPPREVVLPDPHLSPGKRYEIFFCRRQKVYCIHYQELLDKYRSGIRKALQQPQGEIDLDDDKCARIVKFFQDNEIKNQFASLRVEIHEHTLAQILDPQENDPGETVEIIRQPTSVYLRDIKALDATAVFAYFAVWEDSFDTFIEARHLLANNPDLESGWRPFEEGHVPKIVVGSKGGEPIQPD
jgi:hypothetical protein